MDLVEIRRKNLSHYCEDECGGNETELARRAKRAQSQIHDMLAGKKSFGEKIARAIEANINKPRGWLDVDHAVADSSDTFQQRYRLADQATRQLIDLALADPEEAIPEGLSPSLKTMVDMIRTAISTELETKKKNQ